MCVFVWCSPVGDDLDFRSEFDHDFAADQVAGHFLDDAPSVFSTEVIENLLVCDWSFCLGWFLFHENSFCPLGARLVIKTILHLLRRILLPRFCY